MGELLALAERCEKATGPDRELDYDITEAINPWLAAHSYTRVSGDNGWYSATPCIPGGEKVGPASAYTDSLDAAESLLPDNTGVIQYWILGKKPSVSLQRDEWYLHLNAETKTLALCAAALRARASLGER